MDRRKFINLSGLGITSFSIPNFIQSTNPSNSIQPIVASTWDAGLRANVAAWEVLKNGGKALDAVEQGVMVTENELNCCVGLGANPDRDGIVTLDASIMDHEFNCGSVAFLEPKYNFPDCNVTVGASILTLSTAFKLTDFLELNKI